MGLYGLAASLLVVWSIFLGTAAYYKGRDSRSNEVAEYQAAIKASERIAAEAQKRADETAAQVVTVYKDRIKTIREVVPGEIQLVEVVKASNCELPGAWRVLHDSAASGSAAPQDSPGTVSPADAIETVTENYRIARENAARLEALQEIVKSQ